MVLAFAARGESLAALNPAAGTNGYSIATMGEYPPGSSTPKITLTFSKGGKKLWAHVLEHPVEKIAIIEKNGRSFFGLEDGEYRGYDRHGKRILTQYGKFLVASDGGRYIAFNPRGIKGIQGHPLIQVFGVDDGENMSLNSAKGQSRN